MVNIGGPVVEWNKRKLEAHTSNHKRHCHDEQSRLLRHEHFTDGGEVERTAQTVNERHAEQHDGRREDGCEDVFGSGFARFVMVLLKCCKGCEWQ